MRKYQPIWEQLKELKKASVTAPPELHPRIVMAVKKEKNKDYAWKYEQQEIDLIHRLSISYSSTVITFKLEIVSL